MHDSIAAQVAQLEHYIRRGWALVPLHDVGGAPGGPCSCTLGAACRSAGKHPRAPEWQRPEHLVRDAATLQAALQRWPGCNWGLATGLISGVWALDYDPKNVDPARADEVAAVLEACWASATWVQRTGSGGLHFLFTLPEDFVPNNGAGGLPPGFDVRGARRGQAGGGQIVIAPSTSGTGAYEVLADRPPTAPPALVLDAVRPAPPRPTGLAMGVSPSITASPDMIGRYVERAIDGELAELRGCWTERNQRAWRAAARCIEMINTGLVGGEAVYAAWWAAAAAHPDRSVNVPDIELLRVWASAERHVGDRPADLSTVGGPSSWWGGDAILPTGAPGVPLLGGGPGAAGGVSGYPQGAHEPVDKGVAEALPGVASQVTGVVDDPVTALIARMLTPEQLDERPNPVPLINGVLDCATTAWLIGKSGSCKSFVALDIAAHIGRGDPWRGRDVHQGLVIYIVAEGDQGMKLRQAAWRREYGSMKDVLFLPEPVQADERRTPGEGAWSVLVEACRRLRPVLVIIDTQARVTIGLNENDNGEMSYYAEQADRIKRSSGACVLTVHHIGRGGNDARGASSLDGAQDAELKVKREDNAMSIELIMDKQKDQAALPDMTIRLKRSAGGVDPETGRDLSSLVLDHTEVPMLGEPMDGMSITMRRTLALFKLVDRHYARGEGGTRADIRTLFMGLPEIAEMKAGSTRRAAWADAWGELISRGRVARFGNTDRFRVFSPPDGSVDGLLAVNDGSPNDVPPEGWSVHWPESDKAMREAERGMK